MEEVAHSILKKYIKRQKMEDMKIMCVIRRRSWWTKLTDTHQLR